MFSSNTESEIDDYQFPLPGFRFHPTDEELVGFYLRQKIKNKAIGIELIKPIDIYKHNPWDLPNAGNNLGEKEWYFFCKRARKYKNSMRPNRVTGCGFWKATGIDKPIYSHGNQCIGLKKTLVFYKGNAGKGTKTEWMMHEFRLPSHSHSHSSFFGNLTNNVQQAEIWTLCRIFKRSVTCTKYAPNWRDEIAAAKKGHLVFGETNSNTYSDTMDKSYDRKNTFISFSSSFISFDEKKKHAETNQWSSLMMDFSSISELPSPSSTNESPPSTTTTSSFSNFYGDETDLFGYKNKEMLKSISHFALDSCYDDAFGCEQIPYRLD